jgi:hypothetical protein
MAKLFYKGVGTFFDSSTFIILKIADVYRNLFVLWIPWWAVFN